MSVQYQAVGWNRQKRIYDSVLAGGVFAYLMLFVGLGAYLYPGATAETLLIWGFGTLALVLLEVISSHWNPTGHATYSRSVRNGINQVAVAIEGNMRIKFMVALGLSCLGLASAQVAPQHEVGLTLGRLFNGERRGPSTELDLGPGTALQANYGYRFSSGEVAALYGEVHFLASPLREVRSQDQSLTRDLATAFLTPGVRLKLLPRRTIAPYLALGGGWAIFEQSTTSLDGRANSAPRTVHRGAVDLGGGVDFTIWRFVGFRAEVRDFYTGSPAYNTAAVRGGQHNVVAGGGLVLKLGRE